MSESMVLFLVPKKVMHQKQYFEDCLQLHISQIAECKKSFFRYIKQILNMCKATFHLGIVYRVVKIGTILFIS